MSKIKTALVLGTGVIAASGAIAAGANASSAKSAAKGKADTETVYTAITHSAGGYEYAAGDGVDKLFGNTAAVYKIKVGASNKTGIKLTIPFIADYTSNGELSGTGTAVLSVSGTTETVSDGTLDLTKGSGAQKGHSLKGTFSGVGSTTSGEYVFHVKGTYK